MAEQEPSMHKDLVQCPVQETWKIVKKEHSIVLIIYSFLPLACQITEMKSFVISTIGYRELRKERKNED